MFFVLFLDEMPDLKNVEPLVDLLKIVMTPLHITQGLIKMFTKALKKRLLVQKLSKLYDVMGVFVIYQATSLELIMIKIVR